MEYKFSVLVCLPEPALMNHKNTYTGCLLWEKKQHIKQQLNCNVLAFLLPGNVTVMPC